MKVLCLTDFPLSPGDHWIWNYLSEPDEVDFLWTESVDHSARWGKVLTRYPSYFNLALRARQQVSRKHYDLVVAWESKVGIPMALLRRFTHSCSPHFVILTFTPGDIPSIFHPLVHAGLKAVDGVTVLTKEELHTYQRMFDLPASKIHLCLLGTYDNYGQDVPHSAIDKEISTPYVHASGRTARDYATLFAAADGLDVKVIVHGRGYNFAGLKIPTNVHVGDLVSRVSYQRLVSNTLIEVVPLYETLSPIGSSQIVFAMMMAKAVVATRTSSTTDYVEDGVTGMLVKPADAAEMRSAIQYLLAHPERAVEMGIIARKRYEERYTFEAFAHRAHAVLKQVATGVDV